MSNKTIEVRSEITGNVWKIEVSLNDKVEEGDLLITLESMKMEIPILAPVSGLVKEIKVNEGSSVQGEEVVMLLSE